MRSNKKQKGITLIALVITIIILLILAGVSLNLLTGSEGILRKATNAVDLTKYAQAKESLELILMEVKVRVMTEERRHTQVRDCDELDGRDGVTKIEYIKEDNVEYALVTYQNYTFKVDETLKIIGDNRQENDEETDDVIAGGGKYIYNRGKVSEEAGNFRGLNDVNSEYAINEDNLFMTTKPGNYNNGSFIVTENKIDLTNYTKVKCLVSTGDNTQGISGNTFTLFLHDQQLENARENVYKSSQPVTANQTDYIVELDIPDECLNKEYYVGVYGCLQNVYVYKIWLERAETKSLYDNGKVSTEAGNFRGLNDINSEYAINENNLFMTTKIGDKFNGSYIVTENKIDLTDYKKIRCLVSTGDVTQGISGNYFNLFLNDKQLENARESVYKMSSQIGANQTEYNLSLNIPEECKNSEYYVGVFGCLQDVYVYKIWLEK